MTRTVGYVLMPRGTRGGRPQEGDDRGGTKQVRVFEDVYELIYWITEVEGVSSAELLDPLVRAPLLARFEKNKEAIAAIKKARGESPGGKRRPPPRG